MLPPAPPRLPTTFGLPNASVKPFAVGRATVSDGSPAGHDTKMLIGLVGQFCAQVGMLATSETATSDAVRMSAFMILASKVRVLRDTEIGCGQPLASLGLAH